MNLFRNVITALFILCAGPALAVNTQAQYINGNNSTSPTVVAICPNGSLTGSSANCKFVSGGPSTQAQYLNQNESTSPAVVLVCPDPANPGFTTACTFTTGTVTTTGTPVSGELTQFSGASSITNGNLSGDCTTTNTLATVCLATNGVAFGTAATQNTGTSGATVPLLNGANTWSSLQTLSASVQGQNGTASNPTYSFTSDTNTGFYRSAAGTVAFTSAGSANFTIGGSFLSANAAGFQLAVTAASATNPTFRPNQGDSHAGIGAAAAGDVSIVCDETSVATECGRFDTAGAFTVAKLISCTGLQTSAAGLFSCTASDKRVKDDKGVLSSSSDLAYILKAPAIHRFGYKDGYGPAGTHYGFFAQDIQGFDPQLVHRGLATPLTPDGELQFDKVEVLARTPGAIKAIYAQVKDQQSRIAWLGGLIIVLASWNFLLTVTRGRR